MCGMWGWHASQRQAINAANCVLKQLPTYVTYIRVHIHATSCSIFVCSCYCDEVYNALNCALSGPSPTPSCIMHLLPCHCSISADVREGTRKLMLHVGSAKGISAIRSAVHTHLSEVRTFHHTPYVCMYVCMHTSHIHTHPSTVTLTLALQCEGTSPRCPSLLAKGTVAATPGLQPLLSLCAHALAGSFTVSVEGFLSLF